MNIKTLGPYLFILFIIVYLSFIFIQINKQYQEQISPVKKDTENLIFYYDETYVNCKFLNINEVYCIFKDVIKV